MALQQIDFGSEQYRQMVDLRYRVLRQPLGLEFTQEELDKEVHDLLIAAFEDGNILGCCILSSVNKEVLRLRQMAVQQKVQRKGIGASIINFSENLARDRGYKKMMMHARQTAIGFYEKFDFTTTGDEFLEVNLPHRIMEKRI